MHLLQPVGHELERRAETLVERGLQLLVDGRAHLLQLLRVVGAQRIELLLDGRADGLETRVVGFRKIGESLAEMLELVVLRAGHSRELLQRGLRLSRERAAEFLARAPRGACLLGAGIGEILLHVALEIVALRRQHRELAERKRNERDHDDQRREDHDDRDIRHTTASLLRANQPPSASAAYVASQ